MFYYYGGKAAAAHRYPPPRFGTIVEPFAGAAGYSMHHLATHGVERIILQERNPRVVEVWNRLLAMTPAEVLAYPLPDAGQETTDLFLILASASNASLGCSKMTITARAREAIAGQLRRVARLLPAAQARVEIHEGDYRDVPRLDEATYFVDPPYAVPDELAGGSSRGDGYGPHGARSIDFPALGQWCRELPGQVIVCEASGADWLPFEPLYGMTDTIGKRRAEVLWTNEPVTLF